MNECKFYNHSSPWNLERSSFVRFFLFVHLISYRMHVLAVLIKLCVSQKNTRSQLKSPHPPPIRSHHDDDWLPAKWLLLLDMIASSTHSHLNWPLGFLSAILGWKFSFIHPLQICWCVSEIHSLIVRGWRQAHLIQSRACVMMIESRRGEVEEKVIRLSYHVPLPYQGLPLILPSSRQYDLWPHLVSSLWFLLLLVYFEASLVWERERGRSSSTEPWIDLSSCFIIVYMWHLNNEQERGTNEDDHVSHSQGESLNFKSLDCHHHH